MEQHMSNGEIKRNQWGLFTAIALAIVLVVWAVISALGSRNLNQNAADLTATSANRDTATTAAPSTTTGNTTTQSTTTDTTTRGATTSGAANTGAAASTGTAGANNSTTDRDHIDSVNGGGVLKDKSNNTVRTGRGVDTNHPQGTTSPSTNAR